MSGIIEEKDENEDTEETLAALYKAPTRPLDEGLRGLADSRDGFGSPDR